MIYFPGVATGRSNVYGIPPSFVIFSNIFEATGGILQLLYLHCMSLREDIVKQDPSSSGGSLIGIKTRPDTNTPPEMQIIPIPDHPFNSFMTEAAII